MLRAAQRGYRWESGLVAVGAVWGVGEVQCLIGCADRRAVRIKELGQTVQAKVAVVVGL